MCENNIQIIPSGDSAILVRLGSEITEEINKRVHDLHFKLDSSNIKGIIEMVPAYTDLLILYDPLNISYNELNQIINKEIENPSKKETIEQRLIQIPVCYDEEFGSDLAEVSEHTGLSKEEIIRIHSSSKYLVYMLGFTPGFSYLGGMDERIACPRKKIPRQDIPAGSVGIADKQTGIYPIQSPGGWQLIGSTPFNLFDPNRKDVFLCKAGDHLQFIPISKTEFESIKTEQNKL